MLKLLLMVFLFLNCTANLAVKSFNKAADISIKSCNLPYSEVQKQIPAFVKKNLTLYIQVRENDLNSPALDTLLSEVKKSGLKIIIWPLLPRDDGPWANDCNYVKFTDLMHKVVAYIKAQQIVPEYFVVNMENSAAQMDTIKNYLKEKNYFSLMKILFKNRDREKFDVAVKAYKNLVDSLHSGGHKVMITTYPFMLDDMQDNDPDIQDLANVPISGIDWDAYTFTSYRTAYSGDFGVDFTSYIVYSYGVTAKLLYKGRARLAVGVVGHTDHGKGYISQKDLSEDISSAKAAGVKSLDVFYLKGILDDGGVDTWLFSDPRPVAPSEDPKVTTARVFVRSLDKMLDSYKTVATDVLILINVLMTEKEFQL